MRTPFRNKNMLIHRKYDSCYGYYNNKQLVEITDKIDDNYYSTLQFLVKFRYTDILRYLYNYCELADVRNKILMIYLYLC